METPRAIEGMGFSQGIRIDQGDVPVYQFESASYDPFSFAQASVRNDDLFSREQLTYVESRVAEQLLAPLVAQQAVNVVSKGGWKDFVKHYAIEGFSRSARICCGGDFPRNSIDGREISLPIITIGSGFSLCVADLNKGNEAGMDLAARLMKITTQGIEQGLNSYFFNGDSASGILGIANNPMFGLMNSPFSLTDMTIDPLLVLSVLNTAAQQAHYSSGMALPPVDSVIVSPQIARILNTRFLGPLNTNTTIWETHLKQAGIQNVYMAPDMDCLNGNQRSIFYYNKAAIEWNIPLAPTVLPAPSLQPGGWEVVINMIARVSSVFSDYPRHASRLVG